MRRASSSTSVLPFQVYTDCTDGTMLTHAARPPSTSLLASDWDSGPGAVTHTTTNGGGSAPSSS
eukprot:CAMPEP_0185767588 /NCGR_PEP_ID=MMETSP1174-20130828/45014_1 /TAXON_ID=35687 /ORGANISM="Dictyocha speculum, Strain CCMP1381" /LENGTH=63 /DNA_ID=CAMNT_0028451873 /DNA_START=157 /DNA_END=344 /DNA_ORIENTATION=+